MSTSAAIDVAALRADFPILSRRVHGAPLVYLDSAATSQKPTAVLDAMDAYYRETNANVHRGVYELAAEATDRFEAGRDAVARLVGAPREGVDLHQERQRGDQPGRLGVGRPRRCAAGDEILVTEMEHHSNIVPWQIVAEITGADGALRAGHARRRARHGRVPRTAVRARPGWSAVVHASNVLGTINPVAEIARLAHDARRPRAWWTAPRASPTCRSTSPALGCDFLAFTGHKMLGPTGIGVLVGRRTLLECDGARSWAAAR